MGTMAQPTVNAIVNYYGYNASISKVLTNLVPHMPVTMTINLLYADKTLYIAVAEASATNTGSYTNLLYSANMGTGTYMFSFVPTQSNVELKIDYPYFNTKPMLCFTLDSVNYKQQTGNGTSTQLVQISNKLKGGYRFGYGNHEKIDEIAGAGNTIDMGDRWLDTRIGRTPKTDAEARKYPFISPYAYALNTPIQAIDPDGKVVIFINGQHGNVGAKYWSHFDRSVMDRIGDHKKRYYDGAIGGWSNTTRSLGNNNLSAENRFMAGYKQGMADARDIINHLQRNAEGSIVESIKIISHSMGAAYAKGFGAALYHYSIDAANNEYLSNSNPITLSGNHYYPEGSMKGFKIEFEVDFASFQPNSKFNAAINGIKTIQVSHKFDGVVNGKISIGGSYETKQKGVGLSDYHLNSAPNKGHNIQDFKDEIDNVPQSSLNGGSGSGSAPTISKTK
jgi:hypothetical protein